MIRRTKVPSIPDPTPNALVDVAKAIKSTLDVREGRAGDEQDRFVTFRDLKDLSIIVDGETDGGDGTKIPGINPTNPGNGNFPGVPPAPTEFTANGGYGVVILSWRPANYGNHSYTEIWRNTIDALSSAQMVGTSPSAVYADPAPDATTYYYWIRFVNVNSVRGPYNSTSGTPATTAINVPRVIEALSGAITESQLYDSLRSRISLIDADATVEGSMAWRVAQQAEEFGTAIRRVTEITTDQGANIARQSQIMTAAFEDAYAAIAEESETRASEDGLLAGQFISVSAVANSKNRVFFQPDAPNGTGSNPLVTGDMWFKSDDRNLLYRWNGSSWVRDATAPTVYRQTTAPTNTAATPLREGDMWFDSTSNENRPHRWNGSLWVDVRDGFISTVDARVTTVEQSKIGYATLNATGQVFDNNGLIKDRAGVDSWNAANPGNLATWNVGLPLATAIKQVSITAPNGQTATVQQQFEAIYGAGGLRSQYTVKIDANGSVSGFGLASTAVDGVPTSEFYVNANRFAITAPSNATGTSLPGSGPSNGYTFYRTTDKTHWRWNGSSWVSFNPIVPFTVQTTPTTINGVNVPAGVYMDAAFIKDGTITAAKIGNATITSAQIANGTIVQANIGAAQIGSAQIANTIQSDNFSEANNTGWQIIARGGTNLDGRAIFNNIIARGTVYATNGEFTGKITANDGLIGGIRIWSNSIASTNFSPTTGFAIYSDGSAIFRNLTVTDTSGNILLTSSGKIPWSSLISIPSDIYNSNISISSNGTLNGAGGGSVTLNGLGAGDLATRNWVGIGDTVRIFNQATNSYQTLNTEDFVNSLSKITVHNIGTFITGAAIGTAYIGNAAIENANIANAAVQTLNIAGGSVTAMSYAEQPFYGSVDTLPASGSANVVNTTISMAANSSGVVIIAYINMAGVSYGTTVNLRILKNGTAIRDIGLSTIGNSYSSYTVTAFDQYPATGNNTYTLQIQNLPYGQPGGDIPTNYYGASITASGGKR